MIKSLFIILFSVSSFAFASAHNERPADTLVIAYDKLAFRHEALKFPCIEAQNKVSCAPVHIAIQDSTCAKTVQIEKVGSFFKISCRIKFDDVVIGMAPAGIDFISSANPNLGYLPVKLTKNSSLKPSIKPVATGVNIVTEIVVKVQP